MQILASSESLNNYWCIITGTVDDRVAYMMYHDYGNTIMGNWATDAQIRHIDNYNMEEDNVKDNDNNEGVSAPVLDRDLDFWRGYQRY